MHLAGFGSLVVHFYLASAGAFSYFNQFDHLQLAYLLFEHALITILIMEEILM